MASVNKIEKYFHIASPKVEINKKFTIWINNHQNTDERIWKLNTSLNNIA